MVLSSLSTQKRLYKNGKIITTDSNKKEIVPFICDGIIIISNTEGIASIYAGSYSLNTGVPRYSYCGKYFYFNKIGRKDTKEKSFSITVEGVADNHHESFILRSPYYYLPHSLITTIDSLTEQKTYLYQVKKTPSSQDTTSEEPCQGLPYPFFRQD